MAINYDCIQRGRKQRAAPRGSASKQIGRAADLSSLLSGASPDTARRFASAATEVHFRSGARIYTRGDRCTGLYVVISGMVKLSLPLPDRTEKVLALQGPGA